MAQSLSLAETEMQGEKLDGGCIRSKVSEYLADAFAAKSFTPRKKHVLLRCVTKK